MHAQCMRSACAVHGRNSAGAVQEQCRSSAGTARGQWCVRSAQAASMPARSHSLPCAACGTSAPTRRDRRRGRRGTPAAGRAGWQSRRRARRARAGPTSREGGGQATRQHVTHRSLALALTLTLTLTLTLALALTLTLTSKPIPEPNPSQAPSRVCQGAARVA